MFNELGKSIGTKVVNDMVNSGEFSRLVDETIAKTFEQMANEPKYVKIKERLLVSAKLVRDKQEEYRKKKLEEWDKLPWYKRYFGNFDEFCK